MSTVVCRFCGKPVSIRADQSLVRCPGCRAFVLAPAVFNPPKKARQGPRLALGTVLKAVPGLLIVSALLGCCCPVAPVKAPAQPQAKAPVAEFPPVKAPEKPKTPVLEAGKDIFSAGDFNVRVDAVKVAPTMRLNDFEKQTSEKPNTQVFLKVGNSSKTKRLTYRTFYDGGPSKLVDDLGNDYPRRYPGLGYRYSFDTDKGQAIRSAMGRHALDPDFEVSDIIVFDAPVDPAKTLTLTLDADNIGSKGKFSFNIPASMFRK